tara:strand:+ start:138 stop:413 length:276 start_codon:yes stop_codon:yes gene_type:complete
MLVLLLSTSLGKAGFLPSITTFCADAITVRELVQGRGFPGHLVPGTEGILSPPNTTASEFILTVLLAAAVLLIGVGGVAQGQVPPDSTPLL